MTKWYEWRDAPPAEFGVVGDPISHSRSPAMQMAAFRELGLSYRYEAVRVQVGEFSLAVDHLNSLGYRGLNVTVPLKFEALAWASSADANAKEIGAANTLELPTGRATNTDCDGFMATLEPLKLPSGFRAMVLGAGGSAQSIAYALKKLGAEMWIWNRTKNKAAALAERFGGSVIDHPRLDVDLVVNCTAASLEGQGLGLDWAEAQRTCVAYDLAYGKSPFLKAAAERRLRCVDGLPLLVEQGARSLEWWIGVEAPRESMKLAVR